MTILPKTTITASPTGEECDMILIYVDLIYGSSFNSFFFSTVFYGHSSITTLVKFLSTSSGGMHIRKSMNYSLKRLLRL
jgi:hypothetical protein